MRTTSPALAASPPFGAERLVLPQAARPMVRHGVDGPLLA